MENNLKGDLTINSYLERSRCVDTLQAQDFCSKRLTFALIRMPCFRDMPPFRLLLMLTTLKDSAKS